MTFCYRKNKTSYEFHVIEIFAPYDPERIWYAWQTDCSMLTVLAPSILAKIWRKKIQKEFFNEFWLQISQLKYIYIVEIKIGIFYSLVILGTKQFFHAAKNVNLCY